MIRENIIAVLGNSAKHMDYLEILRQNEITVLRRKTVIKRKGWSIYEKNFKMHFQRFDHFDLYSDFFQCLF